jgi:FhuF 2Fe-2S C-terminal domain/Ferric iron reductase FhuF-like transporter
MGPPADACAALADVARVGPFFTLEVDPGVAGDPEWRPFTALQGPALPGEIAAVRARLGVDENRVAASLLFQGIASRLWSPVLASAVEHGTVPDLSPARTYWRTDPIRLAVPEAAGLPADAAAVHRVVLDRHLRRLVAAVRAATPVAEGLLWGNAASALAGALTVLAEQRPAVAAPGGRLVEDLLGMPPLRGTGTLGPRGFRRNSCCLYYRVPGGGLCGDCALR